MSTDQIVKTTVLHASRATVWAAIADARAFGAWFGVRFEGAFAPGAIVRGAIVPTEVDPETAKLQEPHAGKRFEIHVEDLEPERLFSFRWHPFAVDPATDYSAEPMTLVRFELEADGGAADRTRLTITESGFDQLPLARRAAAFAANEGGWTHQTRLVAAYLAQRAHAARPS